MLQGHTTAIVPCGNPTPKKLPTGGGEWPTFRTARAQRTVRPQCLDLAPRGLSSLSALQQGYVQSVHPYRAQLPTCVCPFPRAGAHTGEPAQALGDGETDVTLPCSMRVGVWLCAEMRLFLPAKEKPRR